MPKPRHLTEINVVYHGCLATDGPGVFRNSTEYSNWLNKQTEWGRTKPIGDITLNNGSSLCILQKTQEEKLDSLKYDENDSIFYL